MLFFFFPLIFRCFCTSLSSNIDEARHNVWSLNPEDDISDRAKPKTNYGPPKPVQTIYYRIYREDKIHMATMNSFLITCLSVLLYIHRLNQNGV